MGKLFSGPGKAPLWMSATEYAFGRFLSLGGDQTTGSSAADHFARNGLADADALAKVRARGSGHYPKLVPSSNGTHRLGSAT